MPIYPRDGTYDESVGRHSGPLLLFALGCGSAAYLYDLPLLALHGQHVKGVWGHAVQHEGPGRAGGEGKAERHLLLPAVTDGEERPRGSVGQAMMM